MSTYESFEDLPVWKEAKELAVEVYKMTSDGKINKDYGLKDQIQRAAVSISSNIAEGFERGSKQELIQFLYIARGSVGELRSQLGIAKDIEYITETNFQFLYEASIRVAKQIRGFIEYLKKTHIKGQKFIKEEYKTKTEFLAYLKNFQKSNL